MAAPVHDGAAKVVIHKHQFDSWKDFRNLAARFAVALTITKGAQAVWGTVSIEADTRVNLESRTVAFGDFKVTRVSYPSAKDEPEAKLWEAMTLKLWPANPTTVALERILVLGQESSQRASNKCKTRSPRHPGEHPTRGSGNH